jgi:hypothetical protein
LQQQIYLHFGKENNALQRSGVVHRNQNFASQLGEKIWRDTYKTTLAILVSGIDYDFKRHFNIINIQILSG